MTKAGGSPPLSNGMPPLSRIERRSRSLFRGAVAVAAPDRGIRGVVRRCARRFVKIAAMVQQSSDPSTPEELGRRLLAACRWSDDMRRLALAGARYRCPDAGPQELEAMLYEFRQEWERISQRLRRRQAAIRRDG